MRTEIPLLQNVCVASPCSASWETMTPVDTERVRFCEGCRKRVYNLSAMGQAEAEGLLRAHEGHLCVRYFRRHDGTILTTDCPVGLQAARRLLLTRTRVSLRLCALLCLAFAAFRAATTTTTMGAPLPVQPTPSTSPIKSAPVPSVESPAASAGHLMGDIAANPVRETVGKIAAWPVPHPHPGKQKHAP